MEREDQESFIIDDGGEILDAGSETDSSSSVPKPDCFDAFTRNGMMRIGEESKEHRVIKNQFLTGMNQLAKDTSVVTIHKNIFSTMYMKARFEAFKSCVDAIREHRGDRNEKYGWYGASKQEILLIISYGFSRWNGQSHGLGVYLSTSKFILET